MKTLKVKDCAGNTYYIDPAPYKFHEVTEIIKCYGYDESNYPQGGGRYYFFLSEQDKNEFQKQNPQIKLFQKCCYIHSISVGYSKNEHIYKLTFLKK